MNVILKMLRWFHGNINLGTEQPSIEKLPNKIDYDVDKELKKYFKKENKMKIYKPVQGNDPVTNNPGVVYDSGSHGLTKREYFAAMAMQGLLSAVYSNKEMLDAFTEEKYSPHKTFGRWVSGCDAISKNAISYADSLIAELNKEVKND